MAETTGHVNTCFLTTRLPLWAGVRQNAVGSTLTGKPVPARTMEESLAAMRSEIRALNANAATLREGMADVQQTLSVLSAAVNRLTAE